MDREGSCDVDQRMESKREERRVGEVVGGVKTSAVKSYMIPVEIEVDES